MQQWHNFLIQSQPDSLDEDEASPLNGKGKTKVKARQSGLSQVFAEGVYKTQGSYLAPKESVEWRDQTVLIASLANPPVCLVCTILWELFELGFHHKLHAIDCTMVPDLWVKAPQAQHSLLDCVWPGPHGEMKWKGSLPQEKGNLGFTDAVPHDWPVFNSSCIVLSAWPGAHSGLYKFVTTGDRDVTEVHKTLSSAMLFYVQCFFNRFSRPPIVLHTLPHDFYQ